jgi:hypothetical protein
MLNVFNLAESPDAVLLWVAPSASWAKPRAAAGVPVRDNDREVPRITRVEAERRVAIVAGGAETYETLLQ